MEKNREKVGQTCCYIGAATVFIVAAMFIAGPHNAASKGVVAFVLFWSIMAMMAVHVVDSWSSACDRKATTAKIAEYAFALAPIALMGSVIGIPPAAYLFAAWTVGLAVLALKHSISPPATSPANAPA